MAIFGQLLPELPAHVVEDALGTEPTKQELREVVVHFQREGLCGRRVAEEYLVPFFVASASHGQPEIDILEDILFEVYEDSDMCIQTRSTQCSRLRGGCQQKQ